MIDYSITNEFGYEEDYEYLNKVIDNAFKYEKVKNACFSIVFVDNEKIQDINKNYRGLDRITDVISFAFEDNDKREYNNMRILGEIYICIPRMKEQAIEYGHSETRELSFLTVHGILHLLGYDHMKKEDEIVMFKHQDEILDMEEFTRR